METRLNFKKRSVSESIPKELQRFVDVLGVLPLAWGLKKRRRRRRL
jgi:hypothetical protein